jgi:hypothetical protein
MRDKKSQSYIVFEKLFRLLIEEESKRFDEQYPYWIKVEWGDDAKYKILVTTNRKSLERLKTIIGGVTDKYSLVIKEYESDDAINPLISVLIKDINL